MIINSQAMYYLGENASTAANKNDGSGFGVRLGWNNGPFEIAVGSGRTRYLVGDAAQSNVGGRWDAGFATLMAQYEWDQNAFNNASGVRAKASGYEVGGLIPVGPGQVRIAYSTYKVKLGTNPQAKKLAIGYVHNLSKRTALYVTYARVSNSDGSAQSVFPGVAGNPTTNSSSNGYDLGLRHSF